MTSGLVHWMSRKKLLCGRPTYAVASWTNTEEFVTCLECLEATK